MHVKICGITNLDDALVAIDAGADMLGFNFYAKSPRYIAPDECRSLCAAISNLKSQVTTVGLFVNAQPSFVAAVLDDCGLDLAQLHGDEPVEFIGRLWGRAYKGLRGLGQNNPAAYAAVSPGYPSLLVDSYSPTLYGGTGEIGDWSAAGAVAAQFPIILAGGLNPGNIGQAIAQVRPWGVDTASGVESAPGRKDHAKIRAFVAAAREAAESQISNLQSPVLAEIGD
jgi:phosphoribosylanthranilate isomerase